MALGFIKKVFSFGKDKAETEERPQEDAAPARGNENASFEAALSDAEAHDPVDKDPVSELEMETAGGPAADEAVDAALAEDDEEEDAPLLPGAELSGDMGLVPLSLLQAEAAAEEPAEPLQEPADAVLDADAMDALLDEAEAASAAEPSAIPPVLPKGFSSASERQEPAPAAPQVKLTWFQRLRAGLARTSTQLTTQISALFTKRKLDEDTLDELEDLLIQSDLGVETAMRITGALSSERYGKDVSGEDVARIMAGEITKVLKPVAKPLELDLSHKPHVILVVGVNGTGKTTTIGKLAAKLSGSGLKVMLAAGDTFRAAAIEQLKIWADRTGSEFIGTKLGADASGLAYDAYEQARAQKSDVLIIDTAGRLQNKTELMAELEKIVRVLGKLDPDAPHTVLQTLDATTGQNAMNQVEIFRNVAGVSGLIMTKLDGTARGGILVAIAAKHKLPVYFIGVGEGVDDLEPFEAEDFAKAIAGV
ncbi:signal recognition particle-docking protein FtsY [Agrobacterium sp. SOY23]|uniref:signal recognition particle-docking protein FtsY n=1 Tax=Agrobacterium sp. SOY23 TaxID=3014555 RepID=UPI001B159841|nr:signal recognition particle-docking protein FtsY [Agrobacterium sp. SOY23]MBO9653930.1 signal recognition particle-docking protein FtsY [Agrobacterium tumefaciens]MCZ4432493.1 signal recognition particle-docking protein FtsY [Agrobacterium sp. SOY23]